MKFQNQISKYQISLMVLLDLSHCMCGDFDYAHQDNPPSVLYSQFPHSEDGLMLKILASGASDELKG